MNIFTKTAAVMTGLVILTASLAGCVSKYPAEEIEAVSEQYDYFYKPDVERHDFDRKATVEGLTFYYESSLGSKADGAIENVLSVNEFCEITQPVYLSDRMVTHAEETALYVNVKDDAKLIGATYLAYLGGEALPFGCYAGASAHLLGEKATHPDNLDKHPNAKELQYPHFTRSYGKSAERKAAWGLATEVASDYLSTHTLEELLSSKPEEWGEIFTKHGAEIPTEYIFPVGDTLYPIQVKTESFHYHFACDFVDRYYDNISHDYSSLRDFILENEAFLEETTTLISGNRFAKAANVYFKKYIFTDDPVILEQGNGFADFNNNAIVCDTIQAFSHEVVHFIISFYNGFRTHPFAEALCNYFANISKYSPWFTRIRYDFYLGKDVYDKLLKKNVNVKQVKQITKFQQKLYDYHFGRATEETFDYMKFEVCAAALADRKGMDLEQTGYYSSFRTTFIYYLHQTYGTEALKEFLISYYTFEFDGKTLDDIYEEWQDFLDSFLEENILNEYNAFLAENA